ncbi:MAG: hypothetical protein U0793_25325 [Gemmataceae bacterium]
MYFSAGRGTVPVLKPPHKDMEGKRRKQKPRLFTADLHDGVQRLVASATVELWTRNRRHWRGQILFPAQGGLYADSCYTLKTARETRRIRALDVQLIRGMSWVLFEQVTEERRYE